MESEGMIKELQHKIELIRKFQSGIELQIRQGPDEIFGLYGPWSDFTYDFWDFQHYEYRIKPQPVIRSIQTREEALPLVGKTVQHIEHCWKATIFDIGDKCICFNTMGILTYTFNNAFDTFYLLDDQGKVLHKLGVVEPISE